MPGINSSGGFISVFGLRLILDQPLQSGHFDKPLSPGVMAKVTPTSSPQESVWRIEPRR